MVVLYGELLFLVVLSFAFGGLLAAAVMRLLVRQTEAQVHVEARATVTTEDPS